MVKGGRMDEFVYSTKIKDGMNFIYTKLSPIGLQPENEVVKIWR